MRFVEQGEVLAGVVPGVFPILSLVACNLHEEPGQLLRASGLWSQAQNLEDVHDGRAQSESVHFCYKLLDSRAVRLSSAAILLVEGLGAFSRERSVAIRA